MSGVLNLVGGGGKTPPGTCVGSEISDSDFRFEYEYEYEYEQEQEQEQEHEHGYLERTLD